MAQIQQHVLTALFVTAAAFTSAQVMPGERFQPSDPSQSESAPRAVNDIQTQKFNEIGDFFALQCRRPGQRHSGAEIYAALDVNSLGEVMNSAWYQNRHATTRMSIADLKRGSGDSDPPSEGPWLVTSAKGDGVTPGFAIKDNRGRKYLLKFDPPSHAELASGAEVVASKFFHALGYHVPENYIVHFTRDRLTIERKDGNAPLRDKDVDALLAKVRKDGRHRYRALASRLLEGEPVGPFHFHGVRADDPNDLIPHEHRRSLRGLFVLSAWLNHTDSKSGNTLDMLVTEDGIRYVKHHLIDFGACLGSASFESKSPRQGHEYMMDIKPALAQLFSLGLYVPKWARVKYPRMPSVGAFEPEAFDPEGWKPNYPNPAFENRLAADSFWAAQRVAAFRDDEIRAIVSTGEYTDSKAAEWIANTLIARRDRIVQNYLAGAPVLSRLRIGDNRLLYDEVHPSDRELRIEWLEFDNTNSRPVSRLAGNTAELPAQFAAARDGAYAAARFTSADSGRSVMVYLAKRFGRIDLVGIDRAL